jgi:hypothetical protein
MGRVIRKTALLAALATMCALALPQASIPEHPEHKMARRLPAKGVLNFAEVTPNLYRGAQPERGGLESLAKMGINTVIDLRLTGTDKEGADAKTLGMDFVALPWHCLFPKDDPFAKFLAYLRKHPDKKVFVHCRYGDDRTGMMIAAYRMAVEGWTADEARKEMNAFGFHHVICASLVGYEKSFPEHFKNNPTFHQETKPSSH